MGAVLQVAAQLLFPGRPGLATLGVFGLVAGISYGFELFSLLSGKGHHDVMDAVASIMGGVVGMGLSFIALPLNGEIIARYIS